MVIKMGSNGDTRPPQSLIEDPEFLIPILVTRSQEPGKLEADTCQGLATNPFEDCHLTARLRLISSHSAVADCADVGIAVVKFDEV
jgi:hypothetical protein